MSDRTYTVKELCDRWQVTAGTVGRLIALGSLKAFSVGIKPGAKKPRWRISQKAVDEFEAARSASPPPQPQTRRRRRTGDDVIRFYGD